MSRVHAERFAQVPEWVLLHDELSDRAVRLFGVLLRYARTDDRAFPGRKKLAGDLRCSVDSVDRALAELGEADHDGRPAVTTEHVKRPDGSFATNSYWLWPAIAPVAEEEVRTGAPTQPHGRGHLAAVVPRGGSRTGAAPLQRDSVLEGETEKRHTVSSGKTAQVDRFSEFCTAYPVDSFKKDARKQWDLAIEAGADPDEIIDAVFAYSNTTPVFEGYVMAPHRWLEGERWNDEIEPADLRSARERRYTATEAQFLAAANGGTIQPGGNA